MLLVQRTQAAKASDSRPWGKSVGSLMKSCHASGSCRLLPSREAADATESSAAEDTASDASYSADEHPKDRPAPPPRPHASAPSSEYQPIA